MLWRRRAPGGIGNRPNASFIVSMAAIRVSRGPPISNA
jgi:hypothetical protein